jgi:hypothetical protein
LSISAAISISAKSIFQRKIPPVEGRCQIIERNKEREINGNEINKWRKWKDSGVFVWHEHNKFNEDSTKN